MAHEHRRAAVRERTSVRSGHELDTQAIIRHIPSMRRHAVALTGTAHDANDLVQETLLLVLRRPRVVRGNGRAYLLRAVRNTWVSRRRRSAGRATTDPLHECEELLTHAVDWDGLIDAWAAREALDRLPDRFREAILAVDLLELSYREAAVALNARPGTIMSRVSRGRARVAATLEPAQRH